MKVNSFKSSAWRYGAIGVAAIGYWFVLPHKFWLSCPIRALTGLYCPGCGSTRAVFALAHGNVPLAAHDNALLLAMPVLAALGKYIDRKLARRYLYICLAALLVLVVAFVVLRNQSGSFLAPLSLS